MKKRLLAMFLAALLLATAVGCGDDGENTQMQPDESGTSSQTQPNKKPPVKPDGSTTKPDGSEKPSDKPNENAGITLKSEDTVTLQVGKTHQILASFIPEYATDSTALTYTSSDETILTVDGNGLVTAVKQGSATVSV